MIPKLVMFDCDGVLVNSEEAAWDTQRAYLASHGLHYSDEDRAELLSGLTFEGFIEKISGDYRAQFGKDLPAGFEAGLQEAYKKSDWAAKLHAVDGVKELLQSLKAAGIPFCVVSNSGLASLTEKLKLAGLHDYFHPHIFSQEMVAHPKPAPDAYLFAVQQMGGCRAQNCIVVEDSSTGAQAGIAAGAHVIGFTGATRSATHAEFRLKAAGVAETAATMAAVQRKIFARFGLSGPGSGFSGPCQPPPKPDNH